MHRLFLLLSAVLYLASCTVVPIATQAALGRLDPMTADPAGFVLFFSLPPGVGLKDASATFTVTSQRSDTGEALNSAYPLELLKISPDGEFAFRIAPSSLDALRADQARIAAWEAEAPEANSGSIAVTADGCLTGDEITPDARFSASLQIMQGGPRSPLFRNQPVGNLVDINQQDLDKVTCD